MPFNVEPKCHRRRDARHTLEVSLKFHLEVAPDFPVLQVRVVAPAERVAHLAAVRLAVAAGPAVALVQEVAVGRAAAVRGSHPLRQLWQSNGRLQRSVRASGKIQR